VPAWRKTPHTSMPSSMEMVLISMQYRKAKGETTNEVQYPLRSFASLLLERTGDQVTLSILADDDQIHPVGTVT